MNSNLRSLLKTLPFLLATTAGCGAAAVGWRADRNSSAERPSLPLRTEADDGASATNKLAMSLLTALDARSGAADVNYAFAPASLEVALNMVAVGAVGSTRAGMISALGFDGSSTGPLAASSALLRSFADTASSSTKLLSADKAWAQAGMPIEPTYVQALAHVSQSLGRADFRGAPEAARTAINEWAATQTDGLVRHLFPETSIDERTRLVTADTLLLEAPWKSPFDPLVTSPKDFAAASGTIQVPTMRQVGNFPLVDTEAGRLVELPLDGDRFVLDVFVPGTGAKILGADQLSSMLTALTTAAGEPQPVAIELPLFSTRSALRLDGELKKLGMSEAFSDRADFSAMVRGETLALGGVLQQVAIDVNEAGTRVGVASGVVAEHRMTLLLATEVHVDRPFLYLVRDRRTGAFLVVGRVADPSKG